ncbi:hypothetical protein ACFOLA_06100 [Salinicoccus hispanicus]|uniref:Uncharacterized protein n=1 Tax=Salinicoccus hispanicus TaxID=157225 RepID=A0A6N8TZT1_9STAP|nr:hypothetical protein [Salinicoccus hispanicus]MXQ51334.1 hypothetical protein [Salinicoccus hispanicus]
MEHFFSFISRIESLDYLTQNSKSKLEILFSTKSKSRTAFFIEEEKYFPYILLGESHINLQHNYASSNTFQVENIELNSPVAYKEKQYYFRGIEETEQENIVILEEVPPKRQSKKNSPVTIKIKAETANKLITPVLEVKRGGEHHNISTYLSELLGIPSNKFFVSKSLLVISTMKEISKIKDLKVDIKNKRFNFTTLSPSILLTNNNKNYRYLGTKSKRIKNSDIPSNIFTTQLVGAKFFLEDYLSNKPNKFKTDINKIVIIGNQFIQPNQSSYLYDLIVLAEEVGIPISFYGTTDVIYKGLSQDIIKEFEVYAWTPKFISQPVNIKFDVINSNDSFHKSIKKINSYIKELEEQGHFYLRIRVMELKNLVLQQVYKDRQTLELLNSKLADLQLFYAFDDYISKEFYTLFENRYPYNVTKNIRKYLEKDNELVLVVPMHYKGAADQLIKAHHLKNEIIVAEDVAKIHNNSENNFLLSYLPKKDLSKWFTRFKGNHLTVLFPNVDAKNVNRFINYFNNSLNELEKNNSLNIVYPNNIKWKLDLLKEEPQEASPHYEVDNPITEPSLSFFDVLEEAKNNIEFKENYSSKIVKIDRVFETENSRFLASTQKFKLFHIDDQNFIKQDMARNFEIGDNILLLDIPYSNELYYETLQKGNSDLFLSSSEYINIGNMKELDIEWKEQLRAYYDKHRLTPTLLANEFAKIGFFRSTGFFQSWINPDSVNLVPRDPHFIKYIGILNGNDNLVNNYMKYYKASEKLKEEFKNIRRAMIESLINNKYDEKHLSSLNITASIHTITDIELKEDFYIDEFLSNRLI